MPAPTTATSTVRSVRSGGAGGVRRSNDDRQIEGIA
jgi:hypothetical protein